MAHAGVDPDPVAQFGKALKAIEQMRKINEYNKDPHLKTCTNTANAICGVSSARIFFSFIKHRHLNRKRYLVVSILMHDTFFFLMSQAACKLDSAVFLNARD